jgi:tripartite-type tricarboxylate transporter receptor subunit TctC
MKRFSLALSLAFAIVPAGAQTAWPEKPVHFIVAFAPAGPADVIGRIVGQALQDKWKQTVVIDNRGGGGGNIGASVVARAEPDGYGVLVTTSAFPVNLTLYEKPGYALSDFKTAAYAATTPNILVRSTALKQTNLPDIIAAAKTENLSYSSAGVGTTTQLAGELIFRVIAKVDVRHVPFTGAAPAANALMGGQVPLAMLTLSSAGEFIKAGSMKGVAVTTTHRVPTLPDVPTVNETGIGKVEAATDIFFFMPAKTPQAIIEKFNADVNALIKSGALDKAFAAAGVSPVTLNQAEADAYVAGEAKKWGDVIRAAGVKAE